MLMRESMKAIILLSRSCCTSVHYSASACNENSLSRVEAYPAETRCPLKTVSNTRSHETMRDAEVHFPWMSSDPPRASASRGLGRILIVATAFPTPKRSPGSVMDPSCSVSRVVTTTCFSSFILSEHGVENELHMYIGVQ